MARAGVNSQGRAMAGGRSGVRQGEPSEETLLPLPGPLNARQCPGRWAPRFPGADQGRTPRVVQHLEKIKRGKTFVLESENWVFHGLGGAYNLFYLFYK